MKWRLYGLLVLWLVASYAAAQAEWEVTTLIPEAISLRVPTTEISFSFSLDDYPPKVFPARYPASLPGEGRLPVQIFANTPGTWSLLLEVPDLRTPDNNVLLPSEQIWYRVNQGRWLQASDTPQVIYTQAGNTNGWLELSLEFELELTGAEPAAAYTVNAIVTALRQDQE